VLPTVVVRLAGLRLGTLSAFALAGLVTRVTARRPDIVVRLAPVAPLFISEGAIALERGAEFDGGHRGLRVRGMIRVWAAAALCGHHAGKQKRRHCKSNLSHGSLDIDMRAQARRNDAPQFT
jgi:hypothetical protein